MTRLTRLEYLDLKSNKLTGEILNSIGLMGDVFQSMNAGTLKCYTYCCYLADFAWFESGTIPVGFCLSGSQSVHPLTTLLLGSNNLSGDVNLTHSGNLVKVDIRVRFSMQSINFVSGNF